MNKKKKLSIFNLVMINVIAIDSLRILPMSAEYGFSLITYYLLAALLFFLPTALVSAELATGWPETGGMYVWVREAFGRRFGFFTILLLWFNNACWFPTIMSFIGVTLAYLINPALGNNKLYLMTIVLVLFWGATLLNFRGIRASNILSTTSAIVGTLLPMTFIIVLGIVWLIMKKPLSIEVGWHALLPDLSKMNNLVLLTGVFYSLVGIEMSAAHAGEVEEPQRNYPKAILWSGLLILASLILSSLTIAFVVPKSQLNLLSGLLQAFEVFFSAFHIHGIMPILAFLIALGAMGGTNAWISGPSKGLLVACNDGFFPGKLGATNRHGVPVNILLLQGAIFTILCGLFVLMPTISSAFWLLTNITSILVLTCYIAMFAAAIRLRYKHPNVPRLFKIPGGKIGLWSVNLAGIISCSFTIWVGFLPPSQIPVGNLFTYELIVIGGVLFSCLSPLLLYEIHERWERRRSYRRGADESHSSVL
jgi:putative glutamate/gamma-aminobutyrate antiporter